LSPEEVRSLTLPLIPVPIQRNTREGNQEIKAAHVPESFNEKPNRLPQKDLDLRCIKQNVISYNGNKNSINIYRHRGFIHKYVLSPENLTIVKTCLARLIPRMSRIFSLEILLVQVVYLRTYFQLLALRVLSIRKVTRANLCQKQVRHSTP